MFADALVWKYALIFVQSLLVRTGIIVHTCQKVLKIATYIYCCSSEVRKTL